MEGWPPGINICTSIWCKKIKESHKISQILCDSFCIGIYYEMIDNLTKEGGDVGCLLRIPAIHPNPFAGSGYKCASIRYVCFTCRYFCAFVAAKAPTRRKLLLNFGNLKKLSDFETSPSKNYSLIYPPL